MVSKHVQGRKYVGHPRRRGTGSFRRPPATRRGTAVYLGLPLLVDERRRRRQRRRGLRRVVALHDRRPRIGGSGRRACAEAECRPVVVAAAAGRHEVGVERRRLDRLAVLDARRASTARRLHP